MKLHKENSLSRMFYGVIILAILMPLLIYFVIKPKYEAQILDGVERNAVILANHLVNSMKNDSGQFSTDRVVAWGNTEGEEIAKDFGLIKVKVFAPTGKILYSSDPVDIGTLNQHDYFHQRVAKGQNFTKVVAKDHKTMEGTVIRKDVVETYVPIMEEKKFIGAFELYYDITEARINLAEIFYSTLFTLLVMSTFFIGGFCFLIHKIEVQIAKEKETSRLLEEQQGKMLAANDRLEEKQMTLIQEQDKQNYLFSQLEAAKKEWEVTMDCLGEMVILTDTGMRVVRCNKAVVDFSGVGYADLIGKKWTDILRDNNLGKSSFRGNAYEYFHEASGKWLYFRLYTVKNEENKLSGFVITLSDFTEIKEISKELESKNTEIARNSEKLQQALDKISLLIDHVVNKKSFDITFENKNIRNCWDVKECQQMDCPSYGKKGTRCWLQSGTYCGGEVQGEFAQKYESCSQCNYFQEVTSDPVYMIGEQFNHMMHILNEKNQEVEQAYHELKKTQGQLLQQEKMASIGQLAAGVAHEINNPVGFIASNLGSLRKYSTRLSDFILFQEGAVKEAHNDELLEIFKVEGTKIKLDFIMEDIGDLLEESIDGCDRVKKIVADLKGFSRVDQAERQLVDINECIDTTLNIARNELKYKATIEKEYGELVELECFPQQLNQVFMNLLVNAAHAFEKEGVITITTWQNGGNIYTSIADNGKGIAPENLQHIFEPFFTTKEVGKGTGLGLSIVYDIIEKNHKGDITVDSQEGVGTTFTIRLPIQG